MNPSPTSSAPPGFSRWRWPLTALGALVALLLAYRWFRPASEVGETAWHEVRKGDFTVSIVEGGTLTAVSEVSIRNEVEGTARIIYIVPEGSYVKKDDLLVELDSAQAQDQVNQQNINLEKARFALIQAQAQLDIQRSTTNSNFRAAFLKLQFAELDREKFLEGQRSVDLVEASNKLVQAEAQLAVNLENYVNSTNLQAKGYETKQRVDGDRLAVLNNRNSLIIASNQIWMLQAFDHKKFSQKYDSDVREAEQELIRVVAQSQRLMAQYEADLNTQSNTLALNERKLERDRKNLSSTKIYAPQDGLVVYPVGENRFSQESLIEEGAVVRNRQELIKLPDTSRMKVTIKVHESHINMIRLGLPAFVVLDSMPDLRFTGVVEKVGLLPDTSSRWGNPNLKVYNTDVHITDALPDIKPGVSAKAEVIITNIADAISIPIQAVTTSRGRQVVYLVNGGTSEPRPVEVGLYNTKFIQVLSGLKEGDRVLLAPPFDTQDKDLEGALADETEKARLNGTNRARATTANAQRPSATATNQRPAGFRPDREVPVPGAPPDDRLRTRAPANGDGPGPAPERAEASGPARPAFNREEMMKQFDKDGDGQLSEEERNAMRQAFGGLGGSRTNRGDRSDRGDRGDRPRGGEGRGGGGNGGGGRNRGENPGP